MTLADPTDLLADYRPLPGCHDEMVDRQGALREHWASVGHALGELGLPELRRRQQEAVRLLDADGVTYNVVGRTGAGKAPTHGEHRWSLDPVPVLVASDEWADIERGLIQRAELLDVILADLYGPRDLVRRGLLPPALVYGHPGFLRPADQIRLPGPHQLFTYAADLARDSDGSWCVVADRTQAPSGAGYALENRVVISRLFPSLYRDAQVHRLAPFFRALRTGLQAVAPPRVDDPRIVVLSPGPWSETAFEHAYLASYLGYPLVEGDDLVARDGRVWMRSLGKLEPVDVVLRRVDAWFCDPLELRPDSQLGVPGLVEAARRGTVSIVNPLGTGVLENAGLVPFLPKLAEHVLGQPLRLQSAASWWCGDTASRRHVLANLDRLVIKRVARAEGQSSIFGGDLTRAERAEMKERINARPNEWVGQDAIALAATPTLTHEGLEPRRCVLRTFAVVRGESYTAMPGGLMRVAPSAEQLVISNQSGALAKDTWVLASEPEGLTGFWLQSAPAEMVGPTATISSRAAENLFWLGRYAERSEELVRLLRVVYDRRNEFPGRTNPAGAACLDTLYAALTHVTTTYPGFVGDGAAGKLAAPGGELLDLVIDHRRAGTLAHATRRLLDAAYAVRDQLSGDTWLVVGTLDRTILALEAPTPDRHAEVRGALGHVMQSLLALSGLADESMVRDAGWQFMEVGRRIERALQLVALLQATVTVERDTATDSLLLESVLTSAESIITYRRRYRSRARLATVLDLLLLDADNPRSLVYQLDRLSDAVAALPTSAAERRLPEEARLVLEASTTLRLADTAEVVRAVDGGKRPELEELLGRLASLLRSCADAIDRNHFTHLLPQRPLSTASQDVRHHEPRADLG
jgi:uncharacterized circularly permuted ATP-grasp superfamily protein/uncharacterized alpha-E superfamily protein